MGIRNQNIFFLFLISLALYIVTVLVTCTFYISKHDEIEKQYIVNQGSIHIDYRDVFLGSIIAILMIGGFFLIALINLLYTQATNFLLN